MNLNIALSSNAAESTGSALVTVATIDKLNPESKGTESNVQMIVIE